MLHRRHMLRRGAHGRLRGAIGVERAHAQHRIAPARRVEHVEGRRVLHAHLPARAHGLWDQIVAFQIGILGFQPGV